MTLSLASGRRLGMWADIIVLLAIVVAQVTAVPSAVEATQSTL